MEIIEKPTYNEIDDAAKVAAKIILYCIDNRKESDGDCEYGIGIYKRVVQGQKKYYLVETRKGKAREAEVAADNNIGDEQYHFFAHVHSHPDGYEQKFSTDDYIASYGGKNGELPDSINVENQFTIYLVTKKELVKKGGKDVWQKGLIKFIPPKPSDDITRDLRYLLNQREEYDKRTNAKERELRDKMDTKIWEKGGTQKPIMEDIDNETL